MTASTARADRRATLARLSSETFDLLVIGGGVTGAGIARDAALRGLKVALVEKTDFAAGRRTAACPPESRIACAA